MKKIIVLAWAVCLLAACATQETKTVDKEAEARSEELRQMVRGYGSKQYYTDPLILAILKNDVQEVQEALANHLSEGKEVYSGHIDMAVGICEPYRQANKREPFKVECDETKDPDVKKKNAQIIGLLIQNSNADVNQIEFARLEGRSRYVILTPAGKAKEYNPLAVKYFIPKMDKCTAALSQMQNADDSKPNYYVYADYWRNNNCSVPENAYMHIGGSEMMQTLFKLIGKDKAAVEKVFGNNPTIYEHPSEFREILTYKRIETKEAGGTVAGAKGSFTDYYTYAHSYVFTIDRGVVTNVQDIITSKTSFGKTETQTLEDIKQKDLQDRQNKAGHVVDRRGVIIK